ncbi:MAG: DNA mismatch repair endonuclease MutL [Ruminococcaceae bacterium]|nr:DNA mismatch repair endonuclease MutL [Oscillospiraceae bacterium]
MNKINILGNEISDLIAAGEVVERPASVVKELVENSIDAGASKITVEIRGSGIEYIRVTDNGCGMSNEDAKTAFMKHATSKISTKDDLFAINTLGFRGEALAAISAVSKISLKTKEIESVSGYYVYLEGGKIIEDNEIGSADGTTIEVSDLFFNTPARLKFVKSEQSERAVISALIEKLAISNINIAFTYIINGGVRFITSGNGKLKDAIYSVYGSELASDMLSVNHDENGLSIYGLTGKPLANKPNRNYQMFFVNGRLVKSKTLQQALELSYKNSMMVGRYPICVLFISINTEDIDVNVHPSKLEIKFSHDKMVANAVSIAIRSALASESGVYQIKLSDSEQTEKKPFVNKPEVNVDISKTKVEVPTPVTSFVEKPQRKEVKEVKKINDWEITTYHKPHKENIPFNRNPYIQSKPSNSVTENRLQSNPIEAMAVIKDYVDRNNINISTEEIAEIAKVPNEQKDSILKTNEQSVEVETVKKEEVPSSNIKPEIEEEKEVVLIEEEIPAYKYIGEVFNTYIIIEQEEELVFIDKHALHERMIFEKLRSQDFIEVQTMLIPKLLFLSESDSAVLIDNKEELKKIGFDLEDFGGSIMLREIPTVIESSDIEVLLTEIASDLRLKQNADKELLDKFLYNIACKAAIKSGGRSSEKELRSLIDEYFKKRNSLKYCPHGRPIVFTLTEKAIEKQFKRIVG